MNDIHQHSNTLIIDSKIILLSLLFFAYSLSAFAQPVITTPTIASINNDGATLGGNVTNNGGSAITETGIYWSTTANVTTGDTKELGAGTATGVFTDVISGMGAKTRIYFKAFATNSSLTELSTESDFYTLGNNPGTISTFTSPSQSATIDLSWAASTGATGYLIYQSTGNTAPTPTLTDGAAPTGSPIANVSTLTHTAISLSSFTEYSFTVIPYDWDGSVAATYNYGDPKTLTSVSTTCDEPSTQASGVSFSNIQAGSLQINWAPGDGTGTLIIARKDNAVNESPVPGTSYTADLDFSDEGNAEDINSGNKVIYKGHTSPQILTGLAASTDYHFAFYEFNTTDNCYQLTGAPTASTTTIGTNNTNTISAGSAPLTINSLVNTAGAQVIVFNFTITDLGDDGAGADFTELRFNAGAGNEIADWTQVIAGARLFNSSTTPGASNEDHGTAVITAAQIKIPNISIDHGDALGDIHDGWTRDYKLVIHLKSGLGGLKSSIDGKHFVFELDASGVTLRTGTYSGFNPATTTNSNANAGTNNEITVVASKIRYTTQPSTTATATIALAQQPVLEARDANNNVDLDFTGAITVTTSNPNNLSPANTPAAFVGGYSTFSAFNFQNAGSSTMNVAAGGFNRTNSGTITVSASTTVAQVATGIAPSPLNSDNTNKAVLGFSLTTTGSTLNFAGATITTSSEPDGKIKNLKLYKSTDNDYSTAGDNTLIGATITTPNASSIVISSISESINSSSDYFFIVADIESNVSSSISSNLQLSITNSSDILVSIGNTTGSSFNGTNYAFNDITAPASFTVGSVVSTTGRSIADYWNGTNTGVNVSVPISNDATLMSGSVQIQARVDADAFVNIGSSATISAINTTKVVGLSQANIEGITNFGEGKIIEFRAILTDWDANSTTGTKSGTSLTVDRVAPTISGGIKIYNNSGQGPGDGNHEVILFAFNEAITLSHNDVPKFNAIYGNTGFSVDDESIGDALYLNNGATNAVDASLLNTRLIYLESNDNGLDWSVVAGTNVQYVQSGTSGTGNFIMDIAGNELTAFITVVSNGDAIKPTISPDVMTLFPRASSPEKIIFTLSEQLKISSGAAVTGFSTNTGSIDPAASIYTDNTGAAPFTITLVRSGGIAWDINTKVTYTGGGNILDIADNELDPTTVNLHGLIMETNPPVINSVSIPNAIMKIGDVVPVTISVNDDDLDFPVLTSGTIGGYTLTNLQRTNSTTYSAQFTIVEGGTSFATGDNIPVANLILTDVASNSSSAYSTPIIQGSDLLDAVSPFVISISKASATNGWSTSNGTSATSVVYTVTFNEPVTGIDITDFNLTETGSITGTSAINVTIGGGATAYSVTVDSYSNTGTLKLNFGDNGTVFDTPAGNPVVGAGAIADGSFNSGDVYSIVLPEPTNHVSGVTITNPTTTTLDINWVEGIGGNLPTNYLVILKKSNATFPATVLDGSPNGIPFLTNDTNINDDDIAWRNVSAGSTGFTFNNLLSGTAYDVRIYPYSLASDNSDDNINFKNDGTIPNGSGSTTTAAVSTLSLTSTNATISSLTTALSGASAPQLDAVSNFQFTIKDDGVNEGDDNTSITISQFVITAGAGNGVTDNWSTVIEGAELSAFDADDASTDTHTGVINANNITFGGVNNADNDLGQIDDNESKTYTLKIWLKNPLPAGLDNKDFVFNIDANSGGITITNTSSQFAGAQAANSGDGNNIIQILTTELAWAVQPQAAIGVQSNFTVAPAIEAVDVNGNRDLDYTGIVTSVSNTETIGMNNNPDATGLGLSFAIGIHTFSAGFNYQDAGNGTLTVTSGSLSSPTSNTVTVSYSDNTTITAGAFVEPTSISSLWIDLVSDADYSLDIDITDDAAGVTVDDKVPTQINQIVFNAASLGGLELGTNWMDVIENASIFDGGKLHHIAAGPTFPGSIGGFIDTNSLTFSLLPNTVNGEIGYITDGTTKNYRLYIWFKNPVEATQANTMDGKHFNFNIEGADITVESGSSTLNLVSSAISSGSTNNVIEVIATELRYETQPSETFINETMLTVAVEATDVYGNRDLDYSGGVTVTSSGTMSPSPVAATLLNGVGNTSNITHTALGNGLLLNAKDDLAAFSPTGFDSNPFNIIPGAAESDITVSTITYETDIDYSVHTISPVSAANPKMFQFDINDGTSGGTATDTDALATHVTSLSFDIANSSNLKTIGLFNNSNVLIQELTAANTVTFNLIATPLIIPDDGSSTYHLRATFKTSVTDNAQIAFTVSGALASNQGSSFETPANGLQTSGTVATSSVAGDDNRIIVTATDINYTSQPHPINVSTFTNIDNPYIIVAAQDANLNTDVDYTGPFNGITNNFSTILITQNDPTGNFIAGVYDFQVQAPTFQFITAGIGGQLIISTSGFADATSNVFNVSASQDSYITYVSDGGDIPYIAYPPTGDLTDANSYPIAEFMLHDGNPTLYGDLDGNGGDEDGATTVIGAISLSITNFINLDKVGIFDASGTQYGADKNAGATVTFTGVNFSTITDNATNNFFIKASFKDNTTDITDRAAINIAITNVASAGGSKFEDTANNTGGEPDGFGGYNTATTPIGNNKINVVATGYVFTQQPSAIEGVNKEWDSTPLYPIIRALDAKGNIDLDVSESESAATFSLVAPVAVTCVACTPTFVNGELNLASLRYTSAGVGTLTITDVDVTRTVAIATKSSSMVEVVNTALSAFDISGYVPIGNTVLPSGELNITLLGFDLNLNNGASINPIFDNISINFSQDTTDIFKNIRLYKVINNPVNPSINIDYQLVTGATTINSLSKSQIIIDGFSEILDPLASTSYVIIADVDPSAYSGSGSINLNISANHNYIVQPAGSVNLSGAPILSANFTFVDNRSPLIVNTTPIDGSITVSAATTSFNIEFDEFVSPITPLFELRDFNTQTLINDSFTITSGPSKTFDITFLDALAIPIVLVPDQKYYITLQPNGFVDNTGNLNVTNDKSDDLTDQGFWVFTVQDTTPPNFIFNADKSELEANIYDNGFDIKVKIDEPGTMYALAQPNPGPDPNYATLIADPNTVSINVLEANNYYYLQIRGLTNNTSYDIYVAGEDGGGVSMDATDYSNLALDRAQKITLTTATITDLVSEPIIEICTGEFQEVVAPIIVLEAQNNDFINGLNAFDLTLPTGYTYNETVGVVFATAGGDIPVQPTLTYRNPQTISIEFNTTGTSGRDEIRITGLEIKANSTAVDDNIIITGSITAIPFADVAGILKITSLPPALFDLSPSDLTINSQTTKKVLLTQTVPVNEFDGSTYEFSGNGISGDTLFVDFAAIGANTLTLTQTFDGGCQSVGTKDVNVIDIQFSGLDFTYCENAGIVSVTKNITDPSDPFNGYDLIELTVNTTLLPNPGQTSSFNAADFTIDLAAAFDPADHYKYDFVSLNFVGKYQKRTDVNDEIIVNQKVDIYLTPEVVLRSETIPDIDNDNIIDACEDLGTIKLQGDVKDNPGNVNSVGSGTGLFTLIYNVTGNDESSFITNTGNGTASIISDQLASGPGVGTYTITYEYSNNVSSCVVSNQLTIEINPKPLANFSILGKSTLDGCVDEGLTFQNDSDIITNSTFVWNFDDENAMAGNKNDSTTNGGNLPIHLYESRGTYNVTLTATTDKGCISDVATNAIGIGNNPVTSFSFAQIAVGTPTKFTNTTPSDATTNVDSLAWTINQVFADGFNNSQSEFSASYNHPFTTAGQQEVILTAITDKNCAVSATLTMFTVPEYTLSESVNYDENFDGVANSPDNGDWVAWGTNSSWGVGTSGGDSIAIGNNNFWVTGVDTPYNNDENSYVYSPVFDISGLERPMIQLQKFADLSSGVVIEYTAENLSGSTEYGIDSSKWVLLGALESGAEWYNKDGIETYGGNNQEIGQYGWTGQHTKWETAKHILDAAKSASSDDRIQLRIAFKSSNVNPNGLDGFAFDNILIGNRNRVVLLENFTSTEQPKDTKDENKLIDDFASNNPSVFAIQYHPDLDGEDAIGTTPDADARALYYGIGTTPRVSIDGVADATRTFSDNKWGKKEFNVRALDISPLEITTTIDQTSTSKVEINSIINAKITIAKNYIVHTVIIENIVPAPTGVSIQSKEISFTNVARKMLPSASGQKITAPLLAGSTKMVNNTWSPTKTYNFDELTVLVFVQDEITREIYQANIQTFDSNIITSLDKELAKNGFAAWPNPANNIITLQVNQRVIKNTEVTVYNQLGKIVLRTQINIGEYKVIIQSQNWIPGIYFLLTENNGVPIQKRILVQHK